MAINIKIAESTLHTLRQAAIERIRFFQEALAEHGIIARVRGELEFFPLNRKGLQQAHLLDEEKLAAHLRKDVRGIERVHKEAITSSAQYEFVGGPNPHLPGTGIAEDAPLAAAETLASFKEAFQMNAQRLGLGGVSFRARMGEGTSLSTSGLHINLSLWDKTGTHNLFHAPGRATTDLQRHVVDSMIQTHATAAPAYLPQVASFERISTTAKGNPLDPTFWWNLTSGVPNHAGYMSNKGVTLGNAVNVVAGGLHGKPPIGTIAGRHSSWLYKPLGIMEGMAYPGKRTAMIGWEKPHQYRLESRIAGADADPYVVIAHEMASVYEAVVRHVRPFTQSVPVNHATEKLIEAGGTKFLVDRHRASFHSIALPKTLTQARETMVQDTRMRELLGEDLFHATLSQGAVQAAPSANSHVQALLKESARHTRVRLRNAPHETSEISENMHASFASMVSPVRTERKAESWVSALHNDAGHRQL